MTPILLTLAIAIVPVETVVRDYADVAEQNFFYDDCGKLVFEQVMWIDANDEIVTWRMVKTGNELPRRDWRNGGYVALWMDDKDGASRLRLVRANHFRTTWTQHDPELTAREKFPVSERRELGKR
jgi:hypothetical protein